MATPTKINPEAYKYAGLGIQFAATIGVFAFAGWWLDGKFGTSPWLLILLVFTGFAGALISLIKRVPPAGGKRVRAETPRGDEP